MQRRDRLTYDLGTERQPSSGRSMWMVALLIAVIVIGVLLVAWTLRSTGSEPESGDHLATSPPSHRSRVPAPTPDPSPSSAAREPAGSDAEVVDAAPEGSAQAAQQFVLAWLEPEPDKREQALRGVAVPGLVEQLMVTSEANIPDTSPVGAPTLRDASTYSVEFEQRLRNGSKVRVYLVSDPEARNGWLTTSVEQG